VALMDRLVISGDIDYIVMLKLSGECSGSEHPIRGLLMSRKLGMPMTATRAWRVAYIRTGARIKARFNTRVK
jgi:hypothetical protein